MADRDLKGKVIVITGASSGFGRGAALRFAEAGASVVLAARRDEVLDDLVQECETRGGRALAVPTDVSAQAEVENLLKQSLDEFRRIDVWINNAGVGALGFFWDIPLEDHAHVIQTNLNGVIYGSYLAIRQFRLQNEGILINTASGLGKMPAPYYASYTASKYGVVGLSAALRQELADTEFKDTIRVCTVMPMAMDTPWFDHASNYSGREPQPIPPVYDPQLVIDTYVRLAAEPEDEVVIGPGGGLFTALHGLIPGVVEALMGKNVEVTMDQSSPAPKSSNSLHEPTGEGTSVSGGRL